MLIEFEIKSDTLLLCQYSTLTLSSNTIIDTQKIYCLSSEVVVARSAKKPAKK